MSSDDDEVVPRPGPPKPTSFLEISPNVPEVSVVFDQKQGCYTGVAIQSPQQNSASNRQNLRSQACRDNTDNTNSKEPESYNAWRSKNARFFINSTISTNACQGDQIRQVDSSENTHDQYKIKSNQIERHNYSPIQCNVLKDDFDMGLRHDTVEVETHISNPYVEQLKRNLPKTHNQIVDSCEIRDYIPKFPRNSDSHLTHKHTLPRNFSPNISDFPVNKIHGNSSPNQNKRFSERGNSPIAKNEIKPHPKMIDENNCEHLQFVSHASNSALNPMHNCSSDPITFSQQEAMQPSHFQTMTCAKSSLVHVNPFLGSSTDQYHFNPIRKKPKQYLHPNKLKGSESSCYTQSSSTYQPGHRNDWIAPNCPDSSNAYLQGLQEPCSNFGLKRPDPVRLQHCVCSTYVPDYYIPKCDYTNTPTRFEGLHAIDHNKNHYDGKDTSASIEDLYRIAQMQNEQLKLLQQQVEMLLHRNLSGKNPPKHTGTHNPYLDRTSSSSEVPKHIPIRPSRTKTDINNSLLSIIEESPNQTETQRNVHSNTNQVSVGVMTNMSAQNGQDNESSGEFLEGKAHCCCNCNLTEIKRRSPPQVKLLHSPHDELDHTGKERHIKPDCNDEYTYRNKSQHVDESLALNGEDIQQVAETVESPESSVHIEMQDYKESSSEDDDSAYADNEIIENNEDQPKVGWTFYNTVVGQVNNILSKPSAPVNPVKGHQMDRMHNATLEQLRRINQHLSYVEIDDNQQKRVTFDSIFCPQLGSPAVQHVNVAESDTSMRINALAMKYLKDDQLAKGEVGDRLQDLTLYNVASGNTNLSIATMRYLERYKLSPTAKQSELTVPDYLRPRKQRVHVPQPPQYQATTQSSAPSTKILDITALKQQPKLLAKKKHLSKH